MPEVGLDITCFGKAKDAVSGGHYELLVVVSRIYFAVCCCCWRSRSSSLRFSGALC